MNGLPPLDLMDVSAAADGVIQRGADRTWSLADPDWAAIRPELLTDSDRSVVRFLTYI
jgi:acyl-[acyl-carrier-protein] desaturase